MSGRIKADQAKRLRVAAVQFQHAAGDKAANLATIGAFVAQAAERGVELICFPECCISGYWHLRHLSQEQMRELAEPVPDGPSSQTLSELLRQRAIELAAEHQLVLVLKGHRTLVTDGQRTSYNRTGNPGMATGGTGDVLTGVITGLVCQGLKPFEASHLGIHLHGLHARRPAAGPGWPSNSVTGSGANSAELGPVAAGRAGRRANARMAVRARSITTAYRAHLIDYIELQ
jgi:hypothetical protein